MEIYNEEINDLLVPEHRKLQIHESIEVLDYFWFHIIVLLFHVNCHDNLAFILLDNLV